MLVGLSDAAVLAGLGRCAAIGGHATRAEPLLRYAHEIFQRIGVADVPSVLAELDALTGQDSSSGPTAVEGEGGASAHTGVRRRQPGD
jgi:hypothetical protein